MKCACEVQRASRDPQRATKALKTLCEPGASRNRNPQRATKALKTLCEPGASRNRNPQRATNALKTLCEPGASHNRNPHAAMTAARLCESQTQRATASRKPQAATEDISVAACGLRLRVASGSRSEAGGNAQRGLRVGDATRNPRAAIRNRGRQKPAHARPSCVAGLQLNTYLRKVSNLLTYYLLIYASESPETATFTPLDCKGGLGSQGSRLRLRPCKWHVWDAHTVATQLPLEMDREVVQDASIASTLRLYGTKVLKREGPW